MKKYKEGIREAGWMFEYKGNWYGNTGDFTNKSQEERDEIFVRIKKRYIERIEEVNKLNSNNSTELINKKI
jgi:hypothetical protein